MQRPTRERSGKRGRDGKRPRREKILDAARGLFFKKGYRGTTIQQIASQAGYSKRAVYLDYLNKDELFIRVCIEGGELLLQKLTEVPQEELCVEASIEHLMSAYSAFSREHSEYFRMIFSESTPEIVANCPEELQSRVTYLERACLGVLVAWTERAIRERFVPQIDPWEAAGILLGAATGIILLSTAGVQTVYSKETLESLVEKAVPILREGLRVADPGAGTDLHKQEVADGGRYSA
jgi:AcrR family transcriptional regulator